MKLVLQKATGLDEQMVVEANDADELAAGLKVADARLAATNAKIVAAYDFIGQVKDPHYRYMFTAFLDQFLGISSQAESLARKYKVEAPPDYAEWLAGKQAVPNKAGSHLHSVSKSKPEPVA